MKRILPLFCLLFFMFSCGQDPAMDPLVAARQKLELATSVSFEMSQVWNNTYLNDTLVDPIRKGIFLRTDQADFPYDFIYEGENVTSVNLNGQLRKVELQKGRIITFSPEEAIEDLAYEGNYYSMLTPMMLVKDTAWSRAGAEENIVYYDKVMTDTVDEYGHHYFFARLHIDSLSSQVVMREQMSTRDGKPVQHIQRIFSNFAYNEVDDLTYAYPEGFQTIAYADLEQQRENELIKVGDHLPEFDLTDVDGNTYSEKTLEGKKAVFVFSFIGCGGCELARKDLAKSGFQFSDDYVALYVNPMNTAEQIANYHLNKPWPFKLAATDYDFSAKFGVYSYPTFITVDESGIVEEVIEGYEEEEFLEFLAGKGSVR
ncbi:redoxin domain-containing protein [Neolewinella aurantiaca]|uniref:Redoxin domain-containing protein n=1 Tax=Neolewinella aurantiaca TaxID=2602767 RepID=A0A5C7FKE7_9BACT|nr:redoxin domain-containing protein [Neolewinella aurantiaca]TXF91828.1 redoxin domain-containing protein [Neolewinella aurantiaca]